MQLTKNQLDAFIAACLKHGSGEATVLAAEALERRTRRHGL